MNGSHVTRKRTRTSGGHWITRTIRESSAADLARAKPGEVWQSKDGPILIRDMETRHLANAIRVLETRAAKVAADHPSDSIREQLLQLDSATKARIMFPIYENLWNELTRRLKQEPEAQPSVSRKIDLTP